jgi:DNA-binding MarR family transcriptional regulator
MTGSWTGLRLATTLDLQPVHLAALTEWLGSTKGTVSQTIGVLERKGLVAKRGDPDDRRRVHLQLTRAGQRVLQGADPPPLLARAIAEAGSDELDRSVEVSCGIGSREEDREIAARQDATRGRASTPV